MLGVRDVRAGMNRWIAALRLVGVGFFIGTCLLLGVVAGLWLDNKFDTKPIFMMAGLFLGLIVAGYGVYQMLLPLLQNRQDKEND